MKWITNEEPSTMNNHNVIWAASFSLCKIKVDVLEYFINKQDWHRPVSRLLKELVYYPRLMIDVVNKLKLKVLKFLKLCGRKNKLKFKSK